jgi:hypothetical protein
MDSLRRLFARFDEGERTSIAGPSDKRLAEVDPCHGAASGERQAHRELTNESEANDDDPSPGLDTREPKAVERNRTDRCEGSVLRRYALGDPGTQQPRYGLELGVIGLAGAASGNELTRDNVSHGLADLYGDPRCGVPERNVFIEAGSHRPRCLCQPLGASLAYDLSHEIGPGPGLGQQAGPSQLRHRPFGARGHHTCERLHEDFRRSRHRARHFDDTDWTARRGLHHLKHDGDAKW